MCANHLLPISDARIQILHRQLCMTTPLAQISSRQLAVLTRLTQQPFKSNKKKCRAKK